MIEGQLSLFNQFLSYMARERRIEGNRRREPPTLFLLPFSLHGRALLAELHLFSARLQAAGYALFPPAPPPPAGHVEAYDHCNQNHLQWDEISVVL